MEAIYKELYITTVSFSWHPDYNIDLTNINTLEKNLAGHICSKCKYSYDTDISHEVSDNTLLYSINADISPVVSPYEILCYLIYPMTNLDVYVDIKIDRYINNTLYITLD